ncbi:MAG: glutamine--tRNA ligase, partial [Bacteroidales bacterium]
NIKEIHATYDPETKSGMAESNRKVKATIHWLSVAHTQTAEIRLFDRLFNVSDPDGNEDGKTFIDHINPNSLIMQEGFVEKSLNLKKADPYYQFERIGYFCLDKDSTDHKLVFNKTVSLKQ